MDGILPVVQESADSEPLLDVRRVAARVQRQIGEPIADESNGAMKLTDVTPVVAGWNNAPRLEPVRHPLPIKVLPIVTTPILLSPTETLQPPLRLPIGIAR